MAVGTTGVASAGTGDQKPGGVAAVDSAQDSSCWQESGQSGQNGQIPSPAAKVAGQWMLRWQAERPFDIDVCHGLLQGALSRSKSWMERRRRCLMETAERQMKHLWTWAVWVAAPCGEKLACSRPWHRVEES